MSRIVASEMRDKEVLTNKGTLLGTVFDLEADEKEGDLTHLIIDPHSDEISESLTTDEEGNIKIPFSTVTSVQDSVIVDEKRLSISMRRLKQAKPTTSLGE